MPPRKPARPTAKRTVISTPAVTPRPNAPTKAAGMTPAKARPKTPSSAKAPTKPKAPPAPAKAKPKARAKPKTPPPPSVAIGTVLAIPLDDGRWTACHVVGAADGRPCVAGLRWIGDAAPTLDDLRDVPYLRIDHHNWKGALDWHHVEATPPPPSFHAVGVRPVADLGACNSYGGWSSFGLQIRLQARWDALPEAARRAYKAAPMGPGTDLELDLGSSRRVVRVGCSDLYLVDGDAPVRWAELDRLPRLTKLGYAGADARVLDYVRGRPMIGELSWSRHGRAAIDLRGTNLTEVSVDVAAPLTLTLPRAIRALSVSGDARLLTVVQPGDGVALDVTIGPGPDGQPRLPVRGLPALRSLRLVNAATIEVAPLVAHPGLAGLYLHGTAVRIPDIEALAGLPGLRRLELVHCYGVDAARVPVAAQAWPALAYASVDGYRKPDAARWRACLAGVATVELRGAKTDAWLAANLDNPFRDWIDRSPAVGKQACAAWRKARAALGDGVGAGAAEPILRALITTFNALDGKHGLDTIDREEIGEAFHGLAAVAGVADATAAAWFDRWRDF
ncbi:MAG: hypothetical protein IPL61_15620 [Myxococcales bacterium]|nr:hypothetical protein [Myxococcales bacterium]